MSGVIFKELNTGISIMIKEIDLQLRQAEIIGKPLEEVLWFILNHITPFQYEFFDRWIIINTIKQLSLPNGR